MGIPDKVASLINSEVERRVHEELCAMVVKVSTLYQVPLKIVRKDLLGADRCMGVKKNGILCMHRAVTDGYCLKHIHDPRPIEPINKHREGVKYAPPIVTRVENQFRDLSTIM
jgi:hypothetical protein